MDQYEIIKRLGFGACGAVYLVKQHSSKKLFALKKIEVDERKRTRTKEVVLKEASILSQLKHPHIVLFHESFVDPTGDHVCIILDYCDGGNISEKIQDAAQNCLYFSEKQIMQWFIQIVMAVQYMHSKHVLHRDLKAENVFLNKRNVVKLGDFGISKILDNTIDVAKTVVGTPSYLSPELCQDIPYNSKSDIWAVGCLLYEMCALRRPFDGQSLIGLFFNIVKADYQPLQSDAPKGIQDLVAIMLVKLPENRPSASAILNVPYVKSHLASFISDTESIRAIRGRKDNQLLPGAQGDMNFPKQCKSPSTARRSVNKPVIPPKPVFSGAANKPQGYLKPVEKLEKLDVSPKRDDDEAEYSDDFDESSADEIEEDLPVPADCGEGIKEEEELHFGDAHYVDDFEDVDSEEDLDEVVHQAREAQELEPVDDFFQDEDAADENDLSQTLTQAQVFRKQFEHLSRETDS